MAKHQIERTPQAKRMQQARTALLLDQPFFGVLALQLKLIEDSTIPTMRTNGVVIQYSPAFVDRLTQDQVIGVLAHEVMHCAAGHCWRRGERNLKKWNVACDYVINPIIESAKFKLPVGRLFDPQWIGKCAEYVYDRLPDSDQPDDQDGSDPGGTGEVSDAPSTMPDGSPAPSESDWQQTTKQAAMQAHKQGKLPAELERLIDHTLAPRVDWRTLLRRYVQDIVSADYSWSQPNRRYLAAGLYLPQLRSHACGKISVAVDTSGSIDDVLLAQFASEINAIASELEPSSVELLWCDAKVHRVDTFVRGDVITFTPVGGGGTDFRPVFEHYDLGESTPPSVLIYLTDLYGMFPDSPPDYPVIWCATNEQTAPFGDTVPCLT